MTRRFTAKTHLTVPMGLLAGPGATHLMLEPGTEIEVEDAAATLHGRFLNNRVKLGDLVEIDAAAPSNPDAPAPRVLTKPGSIGDVTIATGSPAKKEG